MSLVRAFNLRNALSSISFRTVRYSSTQVDTPQDENITSAITENKPIDPKDRSKVIPVETSIKYLKSSAYQETYGNEPVWSQYRRNFKGAFPPKKTRRTCIRKQVISTGNPCPICRDEFLVLSEKNPDLLKQFISPQTGGVLSYQKTGLCQKKHVELLVNIQRAKDRGIITYDVPFRTYDYSLYNKSC